MRYLFVLGTYSELCWAELQVVLARYALPAPEKMEPWGAYLTVASELPAETLQALQDTLGGTSKILAVRATFPLDQSLNFAEIVAQHLTELGAKRFVLAEWGRDHLPVLNGEAIKHLLKEQGVHAHFKSAPRSGANAGLLSHHNITELTLAQTTTEILLLHTLSVQDVDGWAQRDMQKPSRNRKRGMLPPKTARMMVNLGIGANQPQAQVVLDPFVGTGTVGIECMTLAVPTFLGSDLDPAAIVEANANLQWYQAKASATTGFEFVVKDVGNLEARDFTHTPTTIVTEPFLGKLTPRPEQIPNIAKGLEKLYRGAFHTFSRLLPNGGRIVLVVPRWGQGKKSLTLSKILTDLTGMGFTILGGPYQAGRPSASTQRDIYVLEYTPYGTR